MTALSAGLKTGQLDSNAVPSHIDVPLAAGARVFPGSTVALNPNGYGVAASAVPGQPTVGVYMDSQVQDNTGGANGAIVVRVRRGLFSRTNSAGNDTLTQADVGRPCFIVDDNVVARTSANGTRPFAGRVAEFAQDGTLYVEMGSSMSADTSVDDLLLTTGAGSLAAQQNNFVVLNGTGVVAQSVEGGPSIGVLQNAPLAGAIAIVRRRGRSVVNASAAVLIGAKVASTVAGTSKAAVAGTVDGAGEHVVGSAVMGDALTLGAAGATHIVDIAPQGVLPTTLA